MQDWLTWQSLQYGFLLIDRKRLGQSLTHILLLHIYFSSHQVRFTTLFPGGKTQGTSVGAEPSCESRSPRPAEPHPAPPPTTLKSWGWVSSPACLLSDPKPHHTQQNRCLSCWAVSHKVPRKDRVFPYPSQFCKTSAEAPGWDNVNLLGC